MSSGISVSIASAPSAEQIAAELESFFRTTFDIPEDDVEFGRDVDVFAGGYVDSVGVVELVTFLERRYSIVFPEDSLFDPRFTNVRGMAEIVAELVQPHS